MKKILIVRPKIDDSQPGVIHYIYPPSYNAQHASHICYNHADEKILKGGAIAEGMLIYTADEEEITRLCQEDGVEEVTHEKAGTLGKKWNPTKIIDGKEKPEFKVNDWIKSEDISKKIIKKNI